MTEDLIKYETALLVKEKGFNEHTENYFWYNSKYHENGEELNCLKKDKKFNLKNRELDNFEIGNPYIKRPSQSILAKWLREKHNIHLVVWWFDKEEKFYFEIGYNNQNGYKAQGGSLNHLFDGYEEAIEIGLVVALNLIK